MATKHKHAKLSNFILPEPVLAKLRVDIAPGGGTNHASSLQVTNFTSTLPTNCSSRPQQSLSMQSNSLILLRQQSSSSAASSDKIVAT